MRTGNFSETFKSSAVAQITAPAVENKRQSKYNGAMPTKHAASRPQLLKADALRAPC